MWVGGAGYSCSTRVLTRPASPLLGGGAREVTASVGRIARVGVQVVCKKRQL